jgi:beta-lactamase class D
MFTLKLSLMFFMFGIPLGINLPTLLSRTSSKMTSISQPQFQSQFSQNLTKNFQEAKSEGCFILYDLKRDRYIRYNSNRCQKRLLMKIP